MSTILSCPSVPCLSSPKHDIGSSSSRNSTTSTKVTQTQLTSSAGTKPTLTSWVQRVGTRRSGSGMRGLRRARPRMRRRERTSTSPGPQTGTTLRLGTRMISLQSLTFEPRNSSLRSSSSLRSMRLLGIPHQNYSSSLMERALSIFTSESESGQYSCLIAGSTFLIYWSTL